MTNTSTLEHWLSPSQAAKIIPFSPWQIRKFCRQGSLKATKKKGSNRILIRYSDLMIFAQTA
ncbi:helix-turn-helix domain-containing protein [Corynebacterium ulcerans]|uniref:helix-turn-helix domain-containing protein n=1 Tax=Corynebacterium ulcerans TaxID=65058 RepID=UPI000269D1F8|nr:helix-turn-helix domain-containing protein [Corynebacterium ulcerans]KPH78599.1 hypothetical protein AFK72_00875 [Corynebacterium ulcerans]KPJ25203.1 hypothetical protein AOT31_00855 [Corynebacterium ulcerans]MBH5303037.1 helix-turn-helix domain-containing protein [Corynebacterium ulcerans]OIS06361.1 hypothetical protein BHG00_06270 [Corynebacterium ulcerans]BAM26379.1 hypothetical protein CULC0102_0178 [Corynebacterium ulcerans 0102]